MCGDKFAVKRLILSQQRIMLFYQLSNCIIVESTLREFVCREAEFALQALAATANAVDLCA